MTIYQEHCVGALFSQKQIPWSSWRQLFVGAMVGFTSLATVVALRSSPWCILAFISAIFFARNAWCSVEGKIAAVKQNMVPAFVYGLRLDCCWSCLSTRVPFLT